MKIALQFAIAFTLLLHTAPAAWRAATEAELKDIIPARAPVEKERIETEFRTASGITDGKGKFIAGVVLITAGYSADGKYSHFLLTQAPIRIGSVKLAPGDYVFGWTKGDEGLHVKFYNAHTGTFLGTAEATRTSRSGRIEQFHLYPPGDNPATQMGAIQIGRFAMPYQVQ